MTTPQKHNHSSPGTGGEYLNPKVIDISEAIVDPQDNVITDLSGLTSAAYRQVGSNGEISTVAASAPETVVARWPGRVDTVYTIRSVVCELQDGSANANVTLRVRDGSSGATIVDSTTAGSSKFGLSASLSSASDVVVTLQNADTVAVDVGYDVEFTEA